MDLIDVEYQPALLPSEQGVPKVRMGYRPMPHATEHRKDFSRTLTPLPTGEKPRWLTPDADRVKGKQGY
jgi:hypothetical protein